MKPDDIQFFATPAAWRAWLESHYGAALEAWVGFFRKDSGRGGITYAEALDEALCFGWIDGIRKKVDAIRYTNRFTPRKPGSYWSEVNTRRARELIALGRMSPAGREAFAARDPARTARYSFERKEATLAANELATFQKRKKAWAFFSAQPPSYRKLAAWWVISARRDETRVRRLATLIAKSAAGQRI